MNIHNYYREELSNKKTISSKKAFLTRNEKQVQIHLNDLLEHKKGGWLLGEPITPIRILRVKTELKVIQNLKASLSKGLKAPASKGLTTLCAINIGVTGRRKKDGTQKKGYIAKKGGKLVKKSTKTRKVKL